MANCEQKGFLERSYLQVDLVMNFLNQPEHIDRKGKTETKKSSRVVKQAAKKRSTKSKDKVSDEDEEKQTSSDSIKGEGKPFRLSCLNSENLTIHRQWMKLLKILPNCERKRR